MQSAIISITIIFFIQCNISISVPMAESSSKFASKFNPKFQIPENFKIFITECMASFKCSAHDFAHCTRVSNLALKISEEEAGADQKIIYISALCHDVLDSKLTTASESDSNEKQLVSLLDEFLTANEISRVLDIIKSVGYKNLLKPDWLNSHQSVEYRCVQDADLLDAIGAVGISRCYSFGGGRNRDLFSLEGYVQVQSHSDYLAQQQQSTSSFELSNLQHFFDKLLRIRSLLTTNVGRRMAQKRHDTMLLFLNAVAEELNDADITDGQLLDQQLDSEC